jgi:SAM-dependent methyltransferase
MDRRIVTRRREATMSASLRPTAEHLLRLVVYRSPVSRVARRVKDLLPGRPPHETAEYWDRETPRLDRAFNSHLGNELRGRVIALLLGSVGPQPRSVLDVGCAFGRLADALTGLGIEEYTGVDLSDEAIRQARRRLAAVAAPGTASRRFVHEDLRAFVPGPGQQFEVIVFNEVLYYLKVDEAVRQVQRYGQWLAPDGVLCLSMKKQPKSEAIGALLRRRFDWVYGTLLQQQPDRGAFRVRRDPARPAYLIALMRPKGAAG